MTYQYHLKDHLGNVRTTFTTGKYTSRYIATMEDENHAQEAKDFYNITNRVPYPLGGKAVRLNSASPIGPALGLEVSRGDTINISVKAYYENATGHGTNSTSVAALAAALTGAYGGLNGGSEAQQLIHDIFNKHAGAALAAGATRSDTHPSAYLNYLVFDTEYNLIASQTGYVGIDGTLPKTEQIVNRNNLVVEQAGYVYIYVSNESQSSHYVFFDNLDVSISESPILETTDYYPFGLTFNQYAKSGMVGQRYLYNAGSEWEEQLGFYMTDQRMLDPSLGRFWGIDGLADLFPSMSPMLYSYNNPIRFNDPLGLFGVPGCAKCGNSTLLDGITVTAFRLPSYSTLFSELQLSASSVNRSLSSDFRKGGLNRVARNFQNKRLHFSYGEFLDEQLRPNKTVDALGLMVTYGIGGTMIATFGAPMLIQTIGEGSVSLSASSVRAALFGTADFTSKGYLTQAVFNMAVETTNQLITVGGSELDVFDIASQGFLGLNTPQSAAVGAVFDFKPFANDRFSVNTGSGALVDFSTGFIAGKIGAINGIQGSGAQPLIQWGADLSLKVVSGGTKKSIE